MKKHLSTNHIAEMPLSGSSSKKPGFSSSSSRLGSSSSSLNPPRKRELSQSRTVQPKPHSQHKRTPSNQSSASRPIPPVHKCALHSPSQSFNRSANHSPAPSLNRSLHQSPKPARKQASVIPRASATPGNPPPTQAPQNDLGSQGIKLSKTDVSRNSETTAARKWPS